MRKVNSQRRALLAAAALLPLAAAAQQESAIEVYKTATCGCCNDWIAYLKGNGFSVRSTNVPDTSPVRARLGLPAKYGSCHTAVVGGYVVEGHVPAREIRRLLAERPAAVGIAVPEMLDRFARDGRPRVQGPARSFRRVAGAARRQFEGFCLLPLIESMKMHKQIVFSLLSLAAAAMVPVAQAQSAGGHALASRRRSSGRCCGRRIVERRTGERRSPTHRQGAGQDHAAPRRDQEPRHAADVDGFPGPRRLAARCGQGRRQGAFFSR